MHIKSNGHDICSIFLCKHFVVFYPINLSYPEKHECRTFFSKKKTSHRHHTRWTVHQEWRTRRTRRQLIQLTRFTFGASCFTTPLVSGDVDIFWIKALQPEPAMRCVYGECVFGWSGFENLNKKTPFWIRMRIHQVSENWNICIIISHYNVQMNWWYEMMLMMEEIVLRIDIHALDPRAFQKWIILYISIQ